MLGFDGSEAGSCSESDMIKFSDALHNSHVHLLVLNHFSCFMAVLVLLSVFNCVVVVEQELCQCRPSDGNCSCCKECMMCLGTLWEECCDCVGKIMFSVCYTISAAQPSHLLHH